MGVHRRIGEYLEAIPPRRRVVLVAGFVGLLVVVLVWWGGPGLIATGSGPVERVVSATVIKPAPCTDTDPVETVRFSTGSAKRDAALDGCGHGKGERIEIELPAEGGQGPLTVRIADTDQGHHYLRRPVGLLLVAMSCLGGGFYAFLVTQGPRPRRAMHA